MDLMLKHIRNFAIIFLILGVGFVWYATRPQKSEVPMAELEGREPRFTEPRPETIPTIGIPEIVGWQAGEAPTPAKGLAVARFAEGLTHPRSMIRLPNGDILVAETNSQARPVEGIRDWIMGKLFERAGAGVPSPDRITLLRDANHDGKAEQRFVLLVGLTSPYGMALVGDTLYVANTDSLMAFPYAPGQTKITAKGRKILKLPAGTPNMHWTRSLIANPAGTLLYVGVGSNSNIGENGLDTEDNRAAILEVDPAKGSYRIFASGLRNPVGMGWEPHSGELWTVVNERDMLGPDLVPDYLTRVEFGAMYGWPWNYWGGYEDKRVEPGRPEIRQYTHRPDYSVGVHVAPLGLRFATGAALGAPFTDGAFVGLHGSWNRDPVSGYKVVFVPFGADGKPLPKSKPIDVLTGFLNKDEKVRGRPVDVVVDQDGALLVTDDTSGIIWRVTKPGAKPAA